MISVERRAGVSDPEKNIMKVMDWVDALAGDGENSFPVQRAAFRRVLEDPDNNMHRLIMDILENVDRDVVKATFQNFFLNANIILNTHLADLLFCFS